MSAEQEEKWSKLMRQAQAGEEVAYRELLGELLEVAQAFLCKRLSVTSEVEDVAQEVLLSVHLARHTYNPERPFAPWFFSILRRRFADYFRSSSRRVPTTSFEQSIDEKLSQPDFSDGLISLSQLKQALTELPEKQRMAFELLRLQGMSFQQASLETGMSEAALRVALHRASKTLKQAVEE